MWILLLSFLSVAALGGGCYLATRLRRFTPFRSFAARHKVLSFFAALLCVALLFAVVSVCINLFSAIVVLLHLILFWLLCDLIGFLCNKLRHRSATRYYAGIAALVLTVAYLALGWHFAHHVYRTEYRLSAQKPLAAPLRVAMLADSHLGITLDGEDFAAQLQRIQAEDPYLLVIVGDFVDDDTTMADMQQACQALGEMKTSYGVYFVFGNHNKGYYQYRNFDSTILRESLTQNHVRILEDESVLLGDSFYLIGRQDRTVRDRLSMQALTAGLDSTKYQIVLDHQPNDYDQEAAAKVDLVLSGHTHGGHIFPAGLIGLATGANDKVYGIEERGSTSFIVTSGISGWGIPFKTGTISEYVMIIIGE